MGANYNSIIEMFDGCSIPVLRGHPVSGKTTALKAVLSVFGIKRFSSGNSDNFQCNKWRGKMCIPRTKNYTVLEIISKQSEQNQNGQGRSYRALTGGYLQYMGV